MLFAHWRVPAEDLHPLIPSGLTLQEFDGSAWMGVVPFYLDVRPRISPYLPWFSGFPEINVRTYVEAEGKPGVWFFSLDALNPVAVWAARRFFHLPYFNAAMTMRRDGDRNYYTSHRKGGGALLEGSYKPTSDVYHAEPGSLEHWLTERYCLYSESPDGLLYRADVHHAPWPLQHAEATIDTNTMLAPIGVELPSDPPLLHFVKRIDVAVWGLERVESVDA